MRTISGKIGQGLTAAGNVANIVSKFSETFKDTAGKLAGTLGVFGAAFGIINSLTKPTVGDILAATNRAIAQLSREVDKRLIQLKCYINQQVLNSEHQLMKNRYKSLFQTWANCISRPYPGEAERCERNAVAAIRANRHFFIPSFANVMQECYAGRTLSDLRIKKLEINFIPYRDYVVLNLMSIQTLMNRYLGKPYYRGYRAQLIEDANRDIMYAQKAYNAIRDLTYSRSFAQCGRTFRCPPYHTTLKWAGKKYRYSNCNCQINPLDVRRCQVQVGFYYIYAHFRIYYFRDSKLTRSARWALNNKARSFIYKQSPVVYNYYHNEVLDLVPTWRSMITKSLRMFLILLYNFFQASYQYVTSNKSYLFLL